MLWRALERIPETYRESLILFYREHQSVAAVAAALELSEDAVKQRLSRGRKSLHEAVLAAGEAPQVNTLRWEDYSQTAIDPTDDCTIWYVGDYLKQGATTYSTRIGAYRLCR